MTRNNRKKKQTVTGLPSQVTSGDNQAAGSEGLPHPTTPMNQTHQQEPGTPTVPMDTSPLIKANPSPQGTPMHTTFTGTQRFTPSTRISALNMVGDLLRKVGVRLIVCFVTWDDSNIPMPLHQALESRLASCRTHISAKDTRHPRSTSPVDAPR